MIGKLTQLSAIVPATDQPATLQRCVLAINEAIDPPEQLIVVDEPAAAGPAAARNVGAQRATGEVLVFVDADVLVHREAFVQIRKAFERDEKLAAVFGSYDDQPGGGSLVSDFRNLLHHYTHQQGAGPAATFWAGLGAIRRHEFLVLGGFDEQRYPRSSIEDIELGLRLSRHGCRVLLDPNLQGKHLKRWTLGSMVRTDLLRRGVPWVKLLLEERHHSSVLNLSWRHRVSAAVSVALIGTLLSGRVRLVPFPLFLLLVLNSSFYRLVYRQRGPMAAAIAIPLHVLHYLTTAGALPLGVVAYFLTHRVAQERTLA
jgi:glycosyltransferase involved in cell wall biosynthesis